MNFGLSESFQLIVWALYGDRTIPSEIGQPPENFLKIFLGKGEIAHNTVGKGEIAHNEQFLLFPQCFQKTCTADT